MRRSSSTGIAEGSRLPYASGEAFLTACVARARKEDRTTMHTHANAMPAVSRSRAPAVNQPGIHAAVTPATRRLLWAGALLLATALPVAGDGLAAVRQNPRAPSVAYLDLAATGSRDVLKGPPATAGMHSGYVVLAPGQSVGEHSTEAYEEAVVVFAGVGELRYGDQPPIALRAGAVAYNPPHSTHNVVNTGSGPLRYVYIVSPASASR
jgi:quercetin dioxygenase-like cupin family protein